MLRIRALPQGFLRELANHRELSDYRHFLLDQVRFKPHVLSEPEEKIINGMNRPLRSAWVTLYDDLIASLRVELGNGDQGESLSLDQVLALLYAPGRSLRERAYGALLQTLSRQGMVFKHILNGVLLNEHLEDLRRGFSSSLDKACLYDGVQKAHVEAMMEVVEDHYPLARRYLRLKARLLDMGQLQITDLLAPIGEEDAEIPFSRAQGLLLDAVEEQAPVLQAMTREFFQKHWIHGEMKTGKRHGAFCKCFAPSQPPFVSLHYGGHLRDVAVLAHELGHAVHYRLASKQSFLNFAPPPVLAETGSTLYEILLFQHLWNREASRPRSIRLVAAHLDGILVTVFRQSVITRFEQAIHRERKDHYLGEKEISQLWWEENQRLYGEDLQMTPAYRWGWALIPHLVHRPFYCYTYVFGNLVAMALYQSLRAQGSDFLERIIHLLSSGCSRAPAELLAELGFDTGQKSSWEEALRYVAQLIQALEKVSVA